MKLTRWLSGALFIVLIPALVVAGMTVRGQHPGTLMLLGGAQPAGGGGGGGDPVVTDNFTESAGTPDLDTHTADTGQTWTDKNTSNDMLIDSTNDFVYLNAVATYGYYSSYDPVDADYCLDANIRTSGASNTSNGLAARYATTGTSTENGYFAAYDGSGVWAIYSLKDLSPTTHGTYAGDSPNGATRAIRFCISGGATTALKLYIGGVLRIDVTDTTSPITDKGHVGLKNYNGATGTADWIDGFKVNETVAAP